MNPSEKHEWLKCAASPLYFIDVYCKVYDPGAGDWIPFALWPAQANALRAILNNLLVIILKARQLGMSWLVIAFALWLMIFKPAATILLFSRRDDEAVHLLTDRMKGMYTRLPDFLKTRSVVESNDHEFQLSNGSVARAFPTTAGDSYTATLVIIDEADLVPNLNLVMRAAKPTIDAGARMILLSRADKTKPQSEFKAIYRAAVQKLNGWAAIFLPWHSRPGRTPEWYAAQRADIVSRTGSDDDLHEQYPATDTEALAPRSLDKRIPANFLERCYAPELPIEPAGNAPAIPGLQIYREPQYGRRYRAGVDPAEGNPTSDESAATFLDDESGEEVACLAGRFEPSTTAAYVDQIGRYYHNAAVMVERNNHGHAVLLWLRDHSKLRRLKGWDGHEGWLSNSKGKALLYANCADAFRDRTTVLHSFMTFTQLASIEGSTLRAPEGERDDRADSYALGLAGDSTTAGNLNVV